MALTQREEEIIAELERQFDEPHRSKPVNFVRGALRPTPIKVVIVVLALLLATIALVAVTTRNLGHAAPRHASPGVTVPASLPTSVTATW